MAGHAGIRGTTSLDEDEGEGDNISNTASAIQLIIGNVESGANREHLLAISTTWFCSRHLTGSRQSRTEMADNECEYGDW